MCHFLHGSPRLAFAIRDWAYVLSPLVEEKGVWGAVVQSCCPAREVVELKVGAQVMLLKVRKNKENPGAECLTRTRLVRLFTLMLQPRIAFPAICDTTTNLCIFASSM